MSTKNRNLFVYMTMVVAVSLLMPFQFAYAAIGFAKTLPERRICQRASQGSIGREPDTV